MFVVLIQSSALTRAMSNDYFNTIGWWRRTIANGSARRTLEWFSARQRPIILLSLAHRELNIISLIIDRGHIQYIEFTAGYYHFVLTPR